MIEAICLSHKLINDFSYREDFLLSTEKGSTYPLAFLEIPYNANYELAGGKFKTFQFALLILMSPSNDDVANDHIAISKAEITGDTI